MKRVNVDYYTDAIRYTQVRVLEIAEEESIAGPAARAHGEVLVRSQVVGFKKIKFFTNENVGDGKLELPENEMHTTAFWITLERGLLTSLPFALSERQSGIFGLLHALESMATLLLMCDRRDLGTAVGERPPSPGVETEWQEFTKSASNPAEMQEFFEPNLYLYDAYPGGIGFSEPLYRVHNLLLRRTRELITGCPAAEQGYVRRVWDRREKRASGRRKRRWRFSGICARENPLKNPGLEGGEPDSTRMSAISQDRVCAIEGVARHCTGHYAKAGGLLPPVKRAALLPIFPVVRRAWRRFWELRRAEINSASIWHCGGGSPSRSAAKRLPGGWMRRRCACWHRMRHTVSPIPNSGFFLTQRRPASWAARERIRF